MLKHIFVLIFVLKHQIFLMLMLKHGKNYVLMLKVVPAKLDVPKPPPFSFCTRDVGFLRNFAFAVTFLLLGIF